GDPGRRRQPARLLGRQLRGRLPLQFRPGAVPRAGLRRAVPAHAGRAGAAPAGAVRPADAMRSLAAAAIALAVLAALPLWIGGPYCPTIASLILIYAVFALGMNVLVGYAGLVTLGHGALFAVAAYAGALMINAGYGHAAVAAGAIAATLLTGAIFAVLA